jgi:hypothetical protein
VECDFGFGFMDWSRKANFMAKKAGKTAKLFGGHLYPP